MIATYHKSFKNQKTIIDTFFWLLNDRKYQNAIPLEIDRRITFNLVDFGTFQVQMKNGGLSAFPKPGGKPDCQINLAGEQFAKALSSLDYFSSNALEEKTEVSDSELLELFMNSVLWEDISKDVMAHIEPANIDYTYSDNPERDTAKLLADGKIIGWFQEGCEFGPRALGRRSILADPRKEGIRDFINSKVKFREDFRPFAPSVLREDVSIYFETDRESPYMILVDNVRPEWKEVIGNVVHVNGTSRVQTVTPDWNPKYYRLLKEFKNISGISVLLNTSLNRKGMPIVETPEDALDFYFNCGIDCLVLGNYIITAKEEYTSKVQKTSQTVTL